MPAAAVLRDTLLLSPRLLAAGLRLLPARALGRNDAPIQQLRSTAFLSEQLNLPEDRIAGARIEEVHSGTSTRSRLLIEYTGDPADAPGPTSLFIKSHPPDFGSALFGVLMDLGGNELSFYRHIRPELPVRAPQVFFCEGDAASYVMLLEDLAETGCEFRTLASKCSLEEARRVVTTLARLHARFWQSERFDSDLSWVNRYETDRNARLLEWVRQLSVPIALEKFGHRLPPEIADAVPLLLERYPRLEPLWAEEPRTLIHGDAHLGNMYFQGEEVGLLDWQVTQRGQGVRDVTYFMINSLDTELRRANQEDLLRLYLATLEEHGVALDFDTAWRQVRLQSVYAWIAGVVTAPSRFQPEDVVLAGLERSCLALLDLDVLTLLREV